MHLRQKAVFVTPIMPALTANGLAMRMGMFVEALSRAARVDVIVVPVAGGPTASNAFLQKLGVRVHVVPVDQRGDTHFALLSKIPNESARLEAFRTYGKPSLASPLSKPVIADIARIMTVCAPDRVHVGRAYMAGCIDAVPNGVPATLDLDEDDQAAFDSQARVARARGDDGVADWLTQEGRACDGWIVRFGSRFERVFVSSRAEARLIMQRHPSLTCDVVENSVEIPNRVPRRDDGATLAFLGTLSHAPNVEGILWFARSVLPRLGARTGVPCRLLIAGARPPASIARLQKHPLISVLGEVPDVAALYRHSTLALAPLFAGGGTRIKLLEATAHGVASIATPVGAAGLSWSAGVHGWIAATSGAFAEACLDALADPAERQKRAARGLDWVRRHHARSIVVNRAARLLTGQPLSGKLR